MVLAGLVGGCARYYQVSDPRTGQMYYTDQLNSDKTGAVNFLDGRTGSRVTLQNSEVRQIPYDVYNASLITPQLPKAK